jgi:CspA family cold shock protein
MQKGTVKNWNASRGFGFIVTEDEEEIFVNANDLHITLKNSGLREGQKVSFDIKSDMKGDRAVNVKAG